MVFMQCRNVYRYQKLFSKKRVRLIVWFSSVPVVIITPVLKVAVVLSTLFSQLTTYTDTTFDPKKRVLLNATGADIATEKIDNEYESTLIEFLETSSIKEWFRPRHLSCVSTSLNVVKGRYKLGSMPEPFRVDCLNQIEWCIVATIPFIVIGVLSGIFLFRKVCSIL